MARKRLWSSFSKALSALLFSLLVCLPHAAQSQDPAAGDRGSSKAATPSPYLIETIIDFNEEIDLRRIWQMLDLEPPAPGAYACRGECEAETFELADGDGGHGQAIALRINYGKTHLYQYLIFRQASSDASGGGGWALLGKIDCFEQQYGPPEHRLEQGDGRTWLVVKALWAQDQGRLVYGETWHEIQQGALKRVLAYPVERRSPACQSQPRCSYKTLLLRHDPENGTYTVPLQFLISCEAADCERRDGPLALFAKGAKAYYAWDAGREQFILDERRSDLTQAQVARLAQAQPPEGAAFVGDHYKELAGIAARGDAPRKAWLKRFLTGIPDTAGKLDLLRLLQQ